MSIRIINEIILIFKFQQYLIFFCSVFFFYVFYFFRHILKLKNLVKKIIKKNVSFLLSESIETVIVLFIYLKKKIFLMENF